MQQKNRAPRALSRFIVSYGNLLPYFDRLEGMSLLKPVDFKRWRKSVDLSQKDAAHALGLKRRVVQYYEKGERDGKKIDIPLTVRLACAAYSAGIRDYHGPEPTMKAVTTDPPSSVLPE